MEDYKKDFIDFLVKKEAFQIQERKLFDGRISPYYINMEKFNDGDNIMDLSFFYMDSIIENHGFSFDVIFGPAYKGIPLAVATSISLTHIYETNKRFCFDRKEAKTHGDATKEKKWVVGDIRDNDRVVMLDDVFTSGKTKYETINLLKGAARNLTYVGLIIGVDRQEVDEDGKNAIEEFTKETRMEVNSVVNVNEIKNYLWETKKINKSEKEDIENYLEKYGIK